MSKIKLLLQVVEDMRSLADSLQEVASAMSEPTDIEEVTPQAPEPQKAEKKATVEEVRAVLVPLSQKGYAEQIRAIFQRYGAGKLSEVKPEDYEAVIAEAEELKNAT